MSRGSGLRTPSSGSDVFLARLKRTPIGAFRPVAAHLHQVRDRAQTLWRGLKCQTFQLPPDLLIQGADPDVAYALSCHRTFPRSVKIESKTFTQNCQEIENPTLFLQNFRSSPDINLGYTLSLHTLDLTRSGGHLRVWR